MSRCDILYNRIDEREGFSDRRPDAGPNVATPSNHTPAMPDIKQSKLARTHLRAWLRHETATTHRQQVNALSGASAKSPDTGNGGHPVSGDLADAPLRCTQARFSAPLPEHSWTQPSRSRLMAPV